MPLNFERLFGGAQCANRWAVLIDERNPARPFRAVPNVNPESAIIAGVAHVEAGDSTIAGITGGGKLGLWVPPLEFKRGFIGEKLESELGSFLCISRRCTPQL